MPSFLIFKRLYHDKTFKHHNTSTSPTSASSAATLSPVSPSITTSPQRKKGPASVKSPLSKSSRSILKQRQNSSSSYDSLPENYTLLDNIGEGAFSKVYKAHDSSTNTLVAIKVITKTALTPKQLANIRNEINTMSHLPSHPNIVPLLKLVDTPSHCYLVVPFYDGGEIFNKIIEYTYFSEPLSRHVFCQLLLAISHCHSNNIVHRDIKPENLLFKRIPFTPNPQPVLRKSDDSSKRDEGIFSPGVGSGEVGQILLADFGLAKKFGPPSSNLHPLKTPCGTAGYTAPEVIAVNGAKQRLPKSFYSKAVDIWLLGCFLYTILCGFPPFYDENPDVVAQKIIACDYHFLAPWWDEISNDAKDLVSRMLVTDPNARITLEDIWHHPWVLENLGPRSAHDRAYFDALGGKLPVPPVKSEPPLPSPSIGNDLLSPPLATPWLPESQIRFQPALMSPRADAIRRVFDTMSDPRSGEQFIENIDEYYQLPRKRGSSPNTSHHARLPRTPDPLLALRNFAGAGGTSGLHTQTLFEHDLWDDEMGTSESDSDDDDDDNANAERVDTITNLVSDVLRKLLVKHLAPDDEASLRLLSNDSDDYDDYRTRSLSVISGANGDFKFTLKLGDSNLLSRRRLSNKGSAPIVNSSPPGTVSSA